MAKIIFFMNICIHLQKSAPAQNKRNEWSLPIIDMHPRSIPQSEKSITKEFKIII